MSTAATVLAIRSVFGPASRTSGKHHQATIQSTAYTFSLTSNSFGMLEKAKKPFDQRRYPFKFGFQTCTHRNHNIQSKSASNINKHHQISHVNMFAYRFVRFYKATGMMGSANIHGSFIERIVNHSIDR
jgi:hypothetical protein